MSINTPKTLNDYKVYLESYIGNMVDITVHVVDITIYESIYNYSLSGSIRFVDNSGLMTSLPLIGQERVHIILNKDVEGSEVDQLTTLIMRVSEIARIEKGSENSASITLKIVDEKSMVQDTLTFSRAMQGVDTKILENLYNEFIKPIHNMPLTKVSEGTASHSMVWPHMTPYQAFDVLLAHASDVNDTPLFLFDTLWSPDSFTERTKLMSYYDMYQQKPYTIEEAVVNNTSRTGDVVNAVASATNRAMDVSQLNNLYKTGAMIRNGVFASSNTAFDISRRSVASIDFNAMDHAPSVANTVHTDRHMLNDATLYQRSNTVKNTYIQNQLSFASQDAFVNRNMIRHNALMSYTKRLSGTYGLSINMDSNVNVRAGAAITVDVDMFAPNLNPTDEMKDYVQSGKFVVSDVKHSITYTEYTMNVTAIRDGMGEEGKL